MTQEQNSGLLVMVAKVAAGNVGLYLLSNYDKVLGAVLTCISILYVSWKFWSEYKKSRGWK